MSRIYENPNQAIYDTLVDIRAEMQQTNNLLGLILEQIRMHPIRYDLPVEVPRG